MTEYKSPTCKLCVGCSRKKTTTKKQHYNYNIKRRWLNVIVTIDDKKIYTTTKLTESDYNLLIKNGYGFMFDTLQHQ